MKLAIKRGYEPVSEKEGLEFADKFGMKHIQISAKTGENVEEAFTSLVKEILHGRLSWAVKNNDVEKCKKLLMEGLELTNT